MVPPPTPLSEDPKTIFEYFLNVYYWYDSEAPGGGAGDEGRKARCQQAWGRLRRKIPTILQTKDKDAVHAFVVEDWAAMNPGVEHSVKAIAFDPPAAEEDPALPAEPSESGSEAGEPTSPPSGPTQKSGEEEEEEDEGDDEEVPVMFSKEYFEGYVFDELGLDVEKWTAAEVNDFLLLGVGGAKKPSQPRVRSLAKAAFENDIDGKLLLAGGAELLVEKTIGHVKWDHATLKCEANVIMTRVRDAIQAASLPYWDRNRQLKELYASSELKEAIIEALKPRPLEDIRYTMLCTRPGNNNQCNVDAINHDVCHSATEANTQAFKVVSVSSPDEPDIIRHNVIFFRVGNAWSILASVDFMAHGEAPPGHWHLNRAPLAEYIPHWGPSRSVYHGSPDMCPLWWLLIPTNTTYYTTPRRHPLQSWVSK